LWTGRASFASRAAVCLLAVAFASGSAGAQGSAAYRSLLERHVKAGRIGVVRLNLVDYAALGRDPLYGQAVADLAASGRPGG
jgi:hypothetical protein